MDSDKNKSKDSDKDSKKDSKFSEMYCDKDCDNHRTIKDNSPVHPAEVLSAMHCCIGVRSDVKPNKIQVKHVHNSKIQFFSLAQVVWSHLEASVEGREAAPENSCVQADWVGSSRQLFIASTSVWRLTRVLITRQNC